jgi:hypothetical protein
VDASGIGNVVRLRWVALLEEQQTGLKVPPTARIADRRPARLNSMNGMVVSAVWAFRGSEADQEQDEGEDAGRRQ